MAFSCSCVDRTRLGDGRLPSRTWLSPIAPGGEGALRLDRASLLPIGDRLVRGLRSRLGDKDPLTDVDAGKELLMLAIRPNCERCDVDLPPACEEAGICTYECTFCAGCVDGVLHNVCPNCGGGFAPRLIRPQLAWREGAFDKAQEPVAACSTSEERFT